MLIYQCIQKCIRKSKLKPDPKYGLVNQLLSGVNLTKLFTNCCFFNCSILLDDRTIRLFNDSLKVSLYFELYFIVSL